MDTKGVLLALGGGENTKGPGTEPLHCLKIIYFPGLMTYWTDWLVLNFCIALTSTLDIVMFQSSQGIITK